MSFLHGVEIRQTPVAGTTRTVPFGAIGLIGTAPTGATNELKLITSAAQAATVFGVDVPGYTIPKSLAAIFAQGGGPVLVVNIFDPADHTVAVVDESKTITNGRAKLTHPPVGAIVLTNAAGSTTYTPDTHYTVDALGNIRVLDSTVIAEASVALATYDRLDASLIANADVIGATTGNDRTGLDLFNTAQGLFGFGAKIMIAPKFGEVAAIAAALIAKLEGWNATAYIDGPSATVTTDGPTDVIAERGVSGTYAGFQTRSTRVVPVWPYLRAFDTPTDATAVVPGSPYIAGALSRATSVVGIGAGPSNIVLQNVLGVEVQLTYGIGDRNSDANLLNAQGVTTFFGGGTNVRVWGQRNASFPDTAGATSFTNVVRIQDAMHESIQASMLPYLGQGITNGVIGAIVEQTNGYLSSLIQEGAIFAGECTYDPLLNPPSQVADGQLVFTIRYAPTVTLELITFNSTLDISLLADLGA